MRAGKTVDPASTNSYFCYKRYSAIILKVTNPLAKAQGICQRFTKTLGEARRTEYTYTRTVDKSLLPVGDIRQAYNRGLIWNYKCKVLEL